MSSLCSRCGPYRPRQRGQFSSSCKYDRTAVVPTEQYPNRELKHASMGSAAAHPPEFQKSYNLAVEMFIAGLPIWAQRHIDVRVSETPDGPKRPSLVSSAHAVGWGAKSSLRRKKKARRKAGLKSELEFNQ